MLQNILRHINLRYVSGASLAHTAVTKAVKRGDIANPKACDCVDCGKPAQCNDHRDYNKPLDVEPVCRGCNYRRGTAIAKTWESETELFGYLGRCKTIRILERQHGFDMQLHSNPVLRKTRKQPKAVA